MTVSLQSDGNSPASKTLFNPDDAGGCQELLRRFAAAKTCVFESGKIRFSSVGERDVYNIAAPFRFCGETLIAGRVEPRATEHAMIILFRRDADDAWRPHPAATTFPGLQDPCITLIGEELVLGGVRYPITLDDGRTISWLSPPARPDGRLQNCQRRLNTNTCNTKYRTPNIELARLLTIQTHDLIV